MDLEEFILQRVSEPVIPNKQFLITEFGAIPDGITDCTSAFEKAMSKISSIGGGKIILPFGEYLTGPIHMKSNVEIHFERGAKIKFIQNPEKYLPVVLTRFEGMELYNYSPFIYAFGQQNISITGEGILDGQSDERHWWPWKGKTEFGWQQGLPEQSKDVRDLLQMVKEQIPVEQRIFGIGHYLRPSFIQFYNCKNVMIDGVKIIRSPMWCIHPVLCSNLIFRNIEIESFGPNNDGINPESCDYVLIENCHFDTGDDSIAIKSGKNEDGRRINKPSQNILIRKNIIHSEYSHGGIVIGSEMSGGVKNIVAKDNLFINLERVLRVKSNTLRGGIVENIFFINNMAINVSQETVIIDLLYDNEEGDYPPLIQDIYVKGLKCINAQYGILVKKPEKAKVKNLVIESSHFESVKIPIVLEDVEKVDIRESTFNSLNIYQLSLNGSLTLS